MPITAYEQLAEFHDLFMVDPWERLRPHVRSAFAQLDAEAVVVEVGAGTGIGTRTIAGETQARIAALEPALVMRSILTARVADDADLAERVTVVAGSAPAVVRPEQLTIGAAAAAAAAGVTATVDAVEYFGHDQLIHLRLADGTPALARTTGDAVATVGARVGVRVTGPVHVLDD